MADRSAIEWTEATWNPTTGCDRVSPGCDRSHAQTPAKRLKAMGSPKYQNDGDPATSGPGFKLTLHRSSLGVPRRWSAPRLVFVDSMSDLFHDDVPPEFIAQAFEVIRETPQHTYQVSPSGRSDWAGSQASSRSMTRLRSRTATVRGVDAWLYEPDAQPKLKHHWEHDRAGFVEVGSQQIGKCPVGMSLDDAQELLDNSIPYFPPRWSRPYPQRLYAVSDGVVYRATPTNPGVSYHGFPEHPDGFPDKGNARQVKQLLLAEAGHQGCRQEVRQWMNW